MAPPLVKGRALLRRRLSGIAFLVVVALLVGLSIGLYNKTFTKVVRVTLQSDRIGNQLTVHADVKLRGVIVGEVRKVSSSGGRANLSLALKPEQVQSIPKNITAQLLPKTLFGEKEVDLVYPTDPSTEMIANGDTIKQDVSRTALETESALNDLLPLLKSLKPQELSITLAALSTALRGRGDKLGSSFAAQAAYLRSLNPSLPTLAKDMQGLADLTSTYSDATPNILRTLDNLSFSSRSVVQQQAALDTFLQSTSDFATSARTLVGDNAQRFTDLASKSIPSLQLYARYSGVYPCLLNRINFSQKETERTEGGPQAGLVITVEAIKDRSGGYDPSTAPKNKETRQFGCFGLGKKPIRPFPVYANAQDGYKDSAPPENPGQGPGGCCAKLAYVAQYATSPVVVARRSLPVALSPLAALLTAPIAGSAP